MPFHTRVIVEDTGETESGREIFRVAQNIIYDIGTQNGTGLHIIIPEGYRTDFASIPRFFWRILPPIGKYGKAAIIHDYLTSCDNFSRQVADAIFYEAMKRCEVPICKRLMIYIAVRAYWVLWRKWKKVKLPYHIQDEDEEKLKKMQDRGC